MKCVDLFQCMLLNGRAGQRPRRLHPQVRSWLTRVTLLFSLHFLNTEIINAGESNCYGIFEKCKMCPLLFTYSCNSSLLIVDRHPVMTKTKPRIVLE